MCLRVTLLIIDLWQYCVCCIRSGVTRCTLLIVLYLCRMCQHELLSVNCLHIDILSASSLQNFAVRQDHYSPLSGPAELSCWPCVRWCGTGGFEEHSQCIFIGLSCSIPFCRLYFFFSLLSVYSLVLWGGVFGLIAYRSLSPNLALLTSFNNNNNNNNNNKNNNELE